MYVGAYQAKCKISKPIGGSLVRQDHLLCLLGCFIALLCNFFCCKLRKTEAATRLKNYLALSVYAGHHFPHLGTDSFIQ